MSADIVFNSGGFYVYKNMASPQLENGYIKIATGKSDNDVLSALIMANLSGTEYQIVLHVIRKTWGYKKKQDWISLTQFEKITGKSRKYIVTSIKRLVNNRILVKTSKQGVKTIYGLNKRFYEWIPLVNNSTLVKYSGATSVVLPTQLVNNSTHTKENNTKENIQKGINKKNILDKMRADLLKDKIINH